MAYLANLRTPLVPVANGLPNLEPETSYRAHNRYENGFWPGTKGLFSSSALVSVGLCASTNVCI